MRRLVLLGGLRFDGSGALVHGRAVQRKRLALLALLGAARGGRASRDVTLGLLWPESETSHARHQLATNVYDLRSALGRDCILSVGDDLLLNPERYSCDVWDFELAVKVGDLEAAASHYGGPLLDGFFLAHAPEFERWVHARRRRLATVFGETVENLAKRSARFGDDREAAKWWERLAVAEPYDSGAVLALMRALVSGGQPGLALERGLGHVRLLEEELGVEADPKFLEFLQSLRKPTAGPPLAGRAAGAVGTASAALATSAEVSRAEEVVSYADEEVTA